MDGSADRADDFAGRVLALHAGHGLEVGLGIVAVALVVGVDADPVHVTAELRLLLADDGDVVFRLAGQHAVVAAHAGVEINGHAPGIVLFLVRIGLVKRQAWRWLFSLFCREVGVLAVFLERRFAD